MPSQGFARAHWREVAFADVPTAHQRSRRLKTGEKHYGTDSPAAQLMPGEYFHRKMEHGATGPGWEHGHSPKEP